MLLLLVVPQTILIYFPCRDKNVQPTIPKYHLFYIHLLIIINHMNKKSLNAASMFFSMLFCIYYKIMQRKSCYSDFSFKLLQHLDWVPSISTTVFGKWYDRMLYLIKFLKAFLCQQNLWFGSWVVSSAYWHKYLL